MTRIQIIFDDRGSIPIANLRRPTALLERDRATAHMGQWSKSDPVLIIGPVRKNRRVHDGVDDVDEALPHHLCRIYFRNFTRCVELRAVADLRLTMRKRRFAILADLDFEIPRAGFVDPSGRPVIGIDMKVVIALVALRIGHVDCPNRHPAVLREHIDSCP